MNVTRFSPIVAAALAAVAVTACGTSSSTADSGAGAAAYGAPQAPRGVSKGSAGLELGAPAAVVGIAAAAGGNGAASSGPGTSIVLGAPPSADIERSARAAYTVPPGTFLTSFEGVISRGVGMGGYVATSTTQPDGSGHIVRGSVTLKVPAAQLAAFLDAMPSSFDASSIDFGSVDHTAQFVDVGARLASARAHLAALDGLLARATSIDDITKLEQQVEVVQAEIDTDQGQLDLLTASVDLATATVELSERGAVVVTPPAPGPLSGGLGSGWNNAVNVTGAVLEGAVSALPVIVLGLAALLLWRRFGRQRRVA